MADGKSSIRQANESTTSSLSLTSTILSSCFSSNVSVDDDSDDYRDQIPSDKKKRKKKRFKPFQKRHSEIRDAKNPAEQKQNKSSTLQQRLKKLTKKKKSKEHKIFHSKTCNDGDDIKNRDGSSVGTPDVAKIIAYDDIGIRGHKRDFRKTTDDRRHSMMAESSDRSAKKEAMTDKLSARVIHVKTNSPELDGIETRSLVECHIVTEESKSELAERLKEISRRELELSQEEDKIRRREIEILTSQHKTIETLNEVANSIGNIAQNPRYVNMAGCKNIQIGTGNEDVKQNLKYVCTILDGLCEKYEDIKYTTEKTLESVKGLQNESTDHGKHLHKLADFLESKLKHHTSSEGQRQTPSASTNVQEQEQICKMCLSKPSNDIWGRSNVRDFVVSSQVELTKNIKQVLTEVTFLKTNLWSLSQTLNCDVPIKTSQKHTEVYELSE